MANRVQIGRQSSRQPVGKKSCRSLGSLDSLDSVAARHPAGADAAVVAVAVLAPSAAIGTHGAPGVVVAEPVWAGDSPIGDSSDGNEYVLEERGRAPRDALRDAHAERLRQR
jgi:hypothetical protein